MADLLTADGLAQLHKIAAGHVGDDRVPDAVVLIARGGQVHLAANYLQMRIGGI